MRYSDSGSAAKPFRHHETWSGVSRCSAYSAIILLILWATNDTATAESPADLAAYCANAFGAGAIAGHDRRDNGPLCSERTSQGLGLLHHKVDPAEICKAQQGTVRFRKQGRQIFCLAEGESPGSNRKIDLTEFCRANYGPSAVVSRRRTDNQPLCTVKSSGGLVQTHHAIDLAELCGRKVTPVSAAGGVLDCGAAGSPEAKSPGDAGGGQGGRSGSEPGSGSGPVPQGQRASGSAPGGGDGILPSGADLDLAGCGRISAPPDPLQWRTPDGGLGWMFGGIETRCPGLHTGRKVDLADFCRRTQHSAYGDVTVRWLDSGRPICEGVDVDPPFLEKDFYATGLDFLWACRDAFPGGESAFLEGRWAAIVKFTNRSLECFYRQATPGPPPEPDQIVEGET